MMDGVAASNSVRETLGDDAAPSGPVDADEDIFGEAGREYIPDLPSKTNGQPLDVLQLIFIHIGHCNAGGMNSKLYL